jgi:hypothetical protein
VTEYFRVDKRLFAVGDRIRTAGEYYANLAGVAKKIEDELENTRPAQKLARTNCLFVFESLPTAEKHWSKMKDGKLYQLAIDDAAIVHRGDMALMDEMKSVIEAGGEYRSIAHEYWNSTMSSTPEVELLISDAVVSDIINISDAERVAFLRKRWGIPAS